MTQTLQKKIRLQAGQRIAIVNASPGFLELLGPLPAGTKLESLPASELDWLLLFAQSSADLTQYGPESMAATKPEGYLWIAYPKKSAGVETDLSRDEGWATIRSAGFRPVTQIALDQTWSALRFRPLEHEQPDDMIAAQYRGKKAVLRPIYDRILKEVQHLGPDIKIQPRKSYVAFARDKQFAVVVPSTTTRIDLGLKLPDVPTSGRLEDGSRVGSSSITHKVALYNPQDVDDQVVAWLREAYMGVD